MELITGIFFLLPITGGAYKCGGWGGGGGVLITGILRYL